MNIEQNGDIGLRIQRVRLENNLTRKELAEAADVSLSHINKIERGESGISNDALCRIVNVLDTSFDFLKYGDLKALEKNIKRKEKKSNPTNDNIEGQMSIFEFI